MFKENNKKTIKEWSLEAGIEIKNPNGFYGRRSQVWNNKYSKKAFCKGARLSEIVCKTDKGLEFLNS